MMRLFRVAEHRSGNSAGAAMPWNRDHDRIRPLWHLPLLCWNCCSI